MVDQRALSLRDETEGIRQSAAMGRLVGPSPVFQDAIRKLPRLARSEASVLIRGETGTGKEVVARTLHYLSRRRSGPFVPINCGAVPIHLVESELFGVEKGAFTGAQESRRGLVEAAEGGTLFLDEVDSLPPAVQVKMLRFLQEGEVRHLGSTRTRRIEVRVVAATQGSRALLRGKDKGRDQGLRDDFFYRLNVLQVHLPPLRDRVDDTLDLVRHFLRKHRSGDGPPVELDESAKRALLLHDWPGNVRELEHVVQRALVLRGGERRIREEHLELAVEPRAARPVGPMAEEKARVVSRFERTYLEKLLALHRGNISRAAEEAQRSRRGFFGLIKKHGIDVARFR